MGNIETPLAVSVALGPPGKAIFNLFLLQKRPAIKSFMHRRRRIPVSDALDRLPDTF